MPSSSSASASVLTLANMPLLWSAVKPSTASKGDAGLYGIYLSTCTPRSLRDTPVDAILNGIISTAMLTVLPVVSIKSAPRRSFWASN